VQKQILQRQFELTTTMPNGRSNNNNQRGRGGKGKPRGGGGGSRTTPNPIGKGGRRSVNSNSQGGVSGRISRLPRGDEVQREDINTRRRSLHEQTSLEAFGAQATAIPGSKRVFAPHSSPGNVSPTLVEIDYDPDNEDAGEEEGGKRSIQQGEATFPSTEEEYCEPKVPLKASSMRMVLRHYVDAVNEEYIGDNGEFPILLVEFFDDFLEPAILTTKWNEWKYCSVKYPMNINRKSYSTSLSEKQNKLRYAMIRRLQSNFNNAVDEGNAVCDDNNIHTRLWINPDVAWLKE